MNRWKQRAKKFLKALEAEEKKHHKLRFRVNVFLNELATKEYVASEAWCELRNILEKDSVKDNRTDARGK